MKYLIGVIASLVGVACLITLCVAGVQWAQQLIAEHGLFTVTSVSLIGLIVCGVIALVAFLLADS